MLEVQNKKKAKGVSFNYKALNKKQCNKNSSYALEDCGMVMKQQYDPKSKADDPTRSKAMLEHPEELLSSNTKKKPNSWICHHCKGKGHIKPYCFMLHGESSKSHQKPLKKKWIPRSINTG